MFSFTPTKNITTGEGGLVTTCDAAFAERLRRLRNHGLSDTGRRVDLGYNWRMSEIQAAIGREQLRRLDCILKRKQRNAERFGQLLLDADVEFPWPQADRTSPFMLMTLRSATRRDEILSGLRALGIEARIYFPPAHLDEVFAGSNVRLPRTERIARTLFSVPFHAQLTDAELKFMAGEITRLAAAV